MTKNKSILSRGLGRGLGAILSEVEEDYNTQLGNSDAKNLIKEINIALIHPNPYQPRKNFDEKALLELSESIKQYGLLQPIIVVQKDDSYILLAGERRLRASKLAKLTNIKAIVADIDQQSMRELALIENIQREDLNPIELASAYKELINKHKITQEELSGIIHKSRAQIANTLRLLNLNARTRELVANNTITQGHAKVLLGLENDKEDTIVDTIVGQKLSVRQTEDLIKSIKNKKKHKKKKQNVHFDSLEILVNRLKSLDYGVKMQNNKLILNFTSEEQIDKLLKKLSL